MTTTNFNGGEQDERDTEIASGADASGEFINPVRLCREIDARLPDDSVLIADGGDFVATASYIVRPRGRLAWLDPADRLEAARRAVAAGTPVLLNAWLDRSDFREGSISM